MADNVAVTAGTGTTIAADEVTDGTLGTVKVQYVKIMGGVLDDTTKAAVGARGLAVDHAAGAASIAKAEDVASADADVGVPAMAIRKATPANTSGTDGDYEMLQVSAGRLWTNSLVGDGTNAVAVKAASTAPAATDPALVVAISPNTQNANGQATMANSTPVVLASNQAAVPVNATGVDQYATYKTVAASQTATALGTGATGDYLAGVLVIPATSAAGLVTVLDNATSIPIFVGGGTTALADCKPFMVPVGAFSVSGAWKITTGANVSVIAIGKFTP